MKVREGPRSISQVLDCVMDQVDGDRVTVENILRSLGTRCYGPGLFLIAFISMLPPISLTPGLPLFTALGTLVLAVQLFMLRPYPWVPRRLHRLSFSREKLERTVARARAWAKHADRIVRPRLPRLVLPPFLNFIALNCIGLALVTIVLAVLPAGENIPAAALSLFGIALTVGDGLLALMGLVATALTVVSLIYSWPMLVGMYQDLVAAVAF